MELDRKGHEAGLAIPLALLAFVEWRRGIPAKPIGRAMAYGPPGESTCLKFLQVCLLHGFPPCLHYAGGGWSLGMRVFAFSPPLPLRTSQKRQNDRHESPLAAHLCFPEGGPQRDCRARAV